jgi:hypothetical protein
MKINSLLVMFLLAFGLYSCEEDVPHIVIEPNEDTVEVVKSRVINNYDGEIPGLDAKVIDYTLPNPYQHKPQLLFDSSIATSWDDAGYPDAKKFILFFKNFQLEVLDRNKASIANKIDFPLRNFKTKEAFLKNFDSIFMPDFVEAVLDQDPLAIYRDEKGAMIGSDGQIWFKMKKGGYRIIAINP